MTLIFETKNRWLLVFDVMVEWNSSSRVSPKMKFVNFKVILGFRPLEIVSNINKHDELDGFMVLFETMNDSKEKVCHKFPRTRAYQFSFKNHVCYSRWGKLKSDCYNKKQFGWYFENLTV